MDPFLKQRLFNQFGRLLIFLVLEFLRQSVRSCTEPPSRWAAEAPGEQGGAHTHLALHQGLSSVPLGLDPLK